MKYKNFRKTMFAQGDEIRLDGYTNGYRTRLACVITSFNDTQLYVMPLVDQYNMTYADENNDAYAEVLETQMCFRNKDVIEIQPIRVAVGGNPPRNPYLPDGEY